MTFVYVVITGERNENNDIAAVHATEKGALRSVTALLKIEKIKGNHYNKTKGQLEWTNYFDFIQIKLHEVKE